ncbi:hypothetical protein WJX74_006849 [Apatococcus lobatus]|uniref:JmjC domain-containing protein n=1 Tax=Apatococcus lobatus TaxID=904363 RepID=A0AAW1RYC8_9CHLO
MTVDQSQCGAAGQCVTSTTKGRAATLSKRQAVHKRQCTKCFRIFCTEQCFKAHQRKCPSDAALTDLTSDIDSDKVWIGNLKTKGIKRGRYKTDSAEDAPGTSQPASQSDEAVYLFVAAALGCHTADDTRRALDHLLTLSSNTLDDSAMALIHCATCKTEQRIAAYAQPDGEAVTSCTCLYCVQCKTDEMQLVCLCESATIRDFMRFMGRCPPDQTLVATSDLDMDQVKPRVDSAMWHDAQPMTLEQLWSSMNLAQLSDQHRSLDTVKAQLQKGEYKEFNFPPATSSALGQVALAVKALQWTSWWRQAVDPFMSSLVLITPTSTSKLRQSGAGVHLDRVSAINLAISTQLVGPSDALATWVFFRPSRLQELYASLEKLQLPPNGKLDPLVPKHSLVITALGAMIVEQCHGQTVHVPPGWAHCVLNRRACFRIAWDTTFLEHATYYPRIAQLISMYIKDRAATDCMPFQTMAINIMCTHHDDQ